MKRSERVKQARPDALRPSETEAGLFAIVTATGTWMLLTRFWLRPGPMRDATIGRAMFEITAVTAACIVGIGVTGYLLLIAAGVL